MNQRALPAATVLALLLLTSSSVVNAEPGDSKNTDNGTTSGVATSSGDLKAGQKKNSGSKPKSARERVVNWNPPTKHDLVERALSDGMTDPKKIVEWAKNYKVTITTEEVIQITAELQKKDDRPR